MYPKKILEHRYSAHGDLELLTKWEGLPNCEHSWELYDNLKYLFPRLHLEGKVPFDGQGNIRQEYM